MQAVVQVHWLKFGINLCKLIKEKREKFNANNMKLLMS